MIASASMVLLLHAAQPLSGMGSGVLRVRLLDGGSVSPSLVSDTANTENAAAQTAEISSSEAQLVADASQNSPQGVNGYLPVSALSERPELLKDIDPEWYLYGLDLPSLSALLLINEYGDVDDLVIDIPFLTPMLLEDLRTRFRAARFLPGRLHGQPVKVALRIVIQLE
jgi:hypothetical protein